MKPGAGTFNRLGRNKYSVVSSWNEYQNDTRCQNVGKISSKCSLTKQLKTLIFDKTNKSLPFFKHWLSIYVLNQLWKPPSFWGIPLTKTRHFPNHLLGFQCYSPLNGCINCLKQPIRWRSRNANQQLLIIARWQYNMVRPNKSIVVMSGKKTRRITNLLAVNLLR